VAVHAVGRPEPGYGVRLLLAHGGERPLGCLAPNFTLGYSSLELVDRHIEMYFDNYHIFELKNMSIAMTTRAKCSVPGIAVLSVLKLSVFKFAQPETTFHARLPDLMTLNSQYGFEGTILTLVPDVLSASNSQIY
jgi:hypothetical protein